MNGYGHFVPALFWSITYWLSISCLLATASIALARRGADDAWPARLRHDAQATYERSFKKYEDLPQPKIVAVDANIDIFPERRSFSGVGHFVLQNKTAQPIGQIHITNQWQSVSNLRFDRPFHVVSSSPRALYTIYRLDTPVAPSDTLNLTFNVGYTSRGFMDGNERPEFAYSATFFDTSYFPTIGYNAGI